MLSMRIYYSMFECDELSIELETKEATILLRRWFNEGPLNEGCHYVVKDGDTVVLDKNMEPEDLALLTAYFAKSLRSKVS